jgi:uncharacterized protein YbbK (DUF523 family)
VKKVLVSACLLGERVRYDGADKRASHPVLARWLAEGRVVPVCPEVAGGLGVPRPPAEQRGEVVVTSAGHDVTANFSQGAQAAVALARREGVTVAVMKDGSPSCGSRRVYDGTFNDVRVAGEGVTVRALRAAGITVFNELEWDQAASALE